MDQASCVKCYVLRESLVGGLPVVVQDIVGGWDVYGNYSEKLILLLVFVNYRLIGFELRREVQVRKR